MAESFERATAKSMSDAKEWASDKLKKAERGVEDAIDQPAETAKGVATAFKDALDHSLKEQPLTTIAGVVVAGFVLGAIWKS